MKVIVDIEPLRRFPQYRRLWLGYLVSQLGSQLTIVAVSYQMFRLTNSSLAVGMVSLVQLVPAIVAGLVGGPLADSHDRRRLMLITQSAMGLSALGLALNDQLGSPRVWPIFLCAGLTAAFGGLDSPTRTATMLMLVDRASIGKATALGQLLQQTSLIIGPAVAGVLLGAWGVSVVYLVDVVSFAVSLAVVASLARLPRTLPSSRPSWLASLREGFAFLRTRPSIQGCFIADLNATIFGMPTALFPAIGLEHFHGGAEYVGLLYAAPGAGAFAAALLTGWTAGVSRAGRAVLLAIGVWGLSLAAFGLVPWFPLALALLALAGAADLVSAVFRGTILQSETPDRLRGRLSSMNIMVVQSGPRLGNVEAAAVAAVAGTTASVVSGGLACVAGVVVMARLMPKFARYRLPAGSEPDEPVAEAATVS